MINRGVLILFLVGIDVSICSSYPPPWGFYAHQLINRHAVYSVPVPLAAFYKKYIEYISEHAVDPDKRRYAIIPEAPRHFIDLDIYETQGLDALPLTDPEASARFLEFKLVFNQDTLNWIQPETVIWLKDSIHVKALGNLLKEVYISKKHLYSFVTSEVIPWEKEFPKKLNTSEWESLGLPPLPTGWECIVYHRLQEHGILPYHLQRMQKQLTRAFTEKDLYRVIQLSAELGHYIADAHVPLHTCSNYNGQKTNQIGIHAFWESRIPELFAEKEYDFVVGRAEYIPNITQRVWKIIQDSHAEVPSVLDKEKECSIVYPLNQQFCFTERLGKTARLQCPDYTDYYQTSMDGMVEERMQESILQIASMWYTAWIDAGQPDMMQLDDPSLELKFKDEKEKLDKASQSTSGFGRDHE